MGRKSYETNHHHYYHKEKRPGCRHHRNRRNTPAQYTGHRWRLRHLRRPHHLRPHHRRFRPWHRPGLAKRIATPAAPANLSPPHDPFHAPDHLLSSIIGPSVAIPYHNRKLLLGTWQRV